MYYDVLYHVLWLLLEWKKFQPVLCKKIKGVDTFQPKLGPWKRSQDSKKEVRFKSVSSDFIWRCTFQSMVFSRNQVWLQHCSCSTRPLKFVLFELSWVTWTFTLVWMECLLETESAFDECFPQLFLRLRPSLGRPDFQLWPSVQFIDQTVPDLLYGSPYRPFSNARQERHNPNWPPRQDNVIFYI